VLKIIDLLFCSPSQRFLFSDRCEPHLNKTTRLQRRDRAGFAPASLLAARQQTGLSNSVLCQAEHNTFLFSCRRTWGRFYMFYSISYCMVRQSDFHIGSACIFEVSMIGYIE
jgi:hypothetical protein